MNPEKRNSIIRVVHNRENPFVQLNKEALWDPRLSLKAVGLWTRCLSRPNDWKFSIAELVTKCKEGRGAIDSAMHELIAANYVIRLEKKDRVNGKFINGIIEYVFFEFPATEEEKAFELEKFKKDYHDLDFKNSGFQNSGNPHLLIKKLKDNEYTEKENSSLKVQAEEAKPAVAESAKASEDELIFSEENEKPKPKEPKDFSPQVQEVASQMVDSLTRHKANYNAPRVMAAFLRHVDYLLRVDKRSPLLVMEVFNWALADAFWCDKMYKPNPAEYLRKQFDQLEMKMKAKPIFKPSSVDRRTKNMDGTIVETPHLKDLF